MNLLTVQQMRERAAKYSYRKGWTIEVREGAFEGSHLEITCRLDDSVELGKTTEFRVNSSIPPQLSIEQFDLYILNRLLRIESHECREWFKLDGKSLYYPHANLSDRDQLEHYYDYHVETFGDIRHHNIDELYIGE